MQHAEDITGLSAQATDGECRDRLVALGTIAAGLVHEVNNALAPVLLQLEAMELELRRLRAAAPAAAAEVARVEARWRAARDGACHVRDVARDVLAFARPGRAVLVPVDVGDALRHAVALAGPRLTSRAALCLELAEVPAVRATEVRLAHVFLNLLLNAALAIPAGAADRHRVTVRTRADAGAVVVTVADTGCGIAAADLPRLFDPCFTTRGDADGNGLGLSFVRAVVTALGGDVAVDSRVGEGTEVRVRLPAA